MTRPHETRRDWIWHAVVTITVLVGAPLSASAQTQLSSDEFAKLHQLIKPQAGESRWREIDWYPSVWEARQRAAAEGKPLFLWAGSGGAPPAGC